MPGLPACEVMGISDRTYQGDNGGGVGGTKVTERPTLKQTGGRRKREGH